MLSVSKTVQEMSKDGDEPPQNYIVRDNTLFGPIDTSPPLALIPVIDISLFLTSPSSLHSSLQEETELEKLRSALSSWGCFQVIGHGMPIEFLNKVRGVTEEFFAMPMEEKGKYSRAAGEIEGYGSDSVVSENQVLDWSDRLSLRIYPEDQRKLRLWPKHPQSFREITHEYSLKVKCVLDILFKAIAKSLNLEEDSFLNQFGPRAHLIARFNFYPPCPRPDQVLGLKPHSDKSGVTVLLQDKEVEGLHVLKDDQWFRVPIVPHALVVNVGDQMQIMSNGMFKSPVHRVVTNSERERITLAVFCMPESNNEIEPVEGLIDEKRPRLYRSMKDYGNNYFQNYQQAKRPIDAAKL
ncbi:hypothetical protein ACSBR1_039461 [Camellia fascicularis]